MATKGMRKKFPRHRRTVLDLLYAASTVPAFPLQTNFHLEALHHARLRCRQRIGWTALFARSYAIVSQAIPELREIFVTYPSAYLYRHPDSVCSISVHRLDECGNERLIWGRIDSPETTSIDTIQDRLLSFAKDPLSQVYREGLILERSPRIARLASWWWVMRWSGRKRAKHVGTFSISSLGGQNCLNGFHPLVTTSSLAFGPIKPNGEMDVVLLCDHRVIDGMLASRALQSLEATLNGPVLDELLRLGCRSLAA
jgi:hypothetical protein